MLASINGGRAMGGITGADEPTSDAPDAPLMASPAATAAGVGADRNLTTAPVCIPSFAISGVTGGVGVGSGEGSSVGAVSGVAALVVPAVADGSVAGVFVAAAVAVTVASAVASGSTCPEVCPPGAAGAQAGPVANRIAAAASIVASKVSCRAVRRFGVIMASPCSHYGAGAVAERRRARACRGC